MAVRYRCLLVDDEPPALEILRTYIVATPMLEVGAECHHGIAAFDLLRQQKFDLIFLDINMPKLLGTELLKSLTNPPNIIFTTAYRDYAVEGFDLGAIDYLLKPYSFDRFLKAINKILQIDHQHTTKEIVLPRDERFLYFRSERKMIKVMVDDILFVESLKDYIRIQTRDQQIITKQTITSLEEILPEQSFVRIHRSFIVAINKIDSYSQHDVYIRKSELPIGPLYRQEIVKRLNQLSA